MTEKDVNLEPVLIQEQMKEAYLDYAMSVIIGRALPDVRDGLKPVHRRILWAMNERAWRHNRPFVKSAKIVGEVIGNFHPHGDGAVYDTMVRMVQEFSMKIPLIDGQGNYGSIDGDRAAAYRYTEARLTKMAELLLQDIDKDTVNFGTNFDESRKEPHVLPASFPNLLVNGSSGIAVGMATNIPPHNLLEVISAIFALLENPDLSIKEIRSFIPAPDFPTGGIILAGEGLDNAYGHGQGTIKIRGKLEITQSTRKKEAIIVTELPYQVNKLNLIQKIADLVNRKIIEGISDIRDESNRLGIRVVIELKKNANAQVILNQLYKQTQLEISYGINFLAIVNRKPEKLNVKEILEEYIKHRREVVTRRTQFELQKAQKREHILLGLKIALENIDEIIKIIRASKNVEVARTSLMSTFTLSEEQANAILEMRLQKLTSLEVQKVLDELARLKVIVADLEDILKDPGRVTSLVKDELQDVKFSRKTKSRYNELSDDEDDEDEGKEKDDDDGTEDLEKLEEKARKKYSRLTEISYESGSASFDVLDLIADKNIVISLTNAGFIKSVDLKTFKNQKRGGKGVTGASKAEDVSKFLVVGRIHQKILLFSNLGKVYLIKCHELPETGKDGRGKTIKSFLPVSEGETIHAITIFDDFNNDDVLCMVTKKGIIKKSQLNVFKNVKGRGIIALSLREGDELIDVKLTGPSDDIFLASKKGKGLRTNLGEMRSMGRAAAGIIGMRLAEDDAIIGMARVKEDASLIVITQKGYGKRISYQNFSAKGRGGKGMAYLNVNNKSGHCVGLASVKDSEEIIITTLSSMIIRIKADSIREMGRTATGVKAVNVTGTDLVNDISIIPETLL